MSKLSFTKVDSCTIHANKGGLFATINTKGNISVRLVGNDVPFMFKTIKGAKAFVSGRALNS